MSVNDTCFFTPRELLQILDVRQLDALCRAKISYWCVLGRRKQKLSSAPRTNQNERIVDYSVREG